jgi:hypothetical protein
MPTRLMEEVVIVLLRFETTIRFWVRKNAGNGNCKHDRGAMVTESRGRAEAVSYADHEYGFAV